MSRTIALQSAIFTDRAAARVTVTEQRLAPIDTGISTTKVDPSNVVYASPLVRLDGVSVSRAEFMERMMVLDQNSSEVPHAQAEVRPFRKVPK